MANIGREMGNLQIATYTHTVMYLPQRGFFFTKAHLSFYHFSVLVETIVLASTPCIINMG